MIKEGFQKKRQIIHTQNRQNTEHSEHSEQPETTAAHSAEHLAAYSAEHSAAQAAAWAIISKLDSSGGRVGNYPKGSVWASSRVVGGGENSEVGAEHKRRIKRQPLEPK